MSSPRSSHPVELFSSSHCASLWSLYVPILKTHHLVKSPLLLLLFRCMSFLKDSRWLRIHLFAAYLCPSSAHLCSLIRNIQLPMHQQHWFKFLDRRCLNKPLVAVGNEKPFQVPTITSLISWQYYILEINVEDLFYEAALKITFIFFLVNDESLGQDRTMLTQSLLGVICFQF